MITTPFQIRALDAASIVGSKFSHHNGNGVNPVIEIRRVDTAQRLLCSLYDLSGDPEVLDDITAASIVADIMRPGWTDRIVRRAAPAVQQGLVYYSFVLERSGSLRAVTGRRWRLRGVYPTSLGRPFFWMDIVTLVDTWHRTVVVGDSTLDM